MSEPAGIIKLQASQTEVLAVAEWLRTHCEANNPGESWLLVGLGIKGSGRCKVELNAERWRRVNSMRNRRLCTQIGLSQRSRCRAIAVSALTGPYWRVLSADALQTSALFTKLTLTSLRFDWLNVATGEVVAYWSSRKDPAGSSLKVTCAKEERENNYRGALRSMDEPELEL